MREFNRGGGDRGGRGDRFGGQSRFGGSRGPRRDNDRFDRSDRPMMHQAVCAECGQDCEVPFKPSGNKPVLCDFCFGKQRDSFSGDRFGGRDSGRRESSRPSFDRPERSERVSGDQYKQQFEMLNEKLDSILRLLNTKSAVIKEEKVEMIEMVKEKLAKKEVTKKPATKKAAKPAKKTTAKKK
ncbi:MAG TPA: hypothetical protein PKN62_01720 [bacterium]|nr:hypothetical protein [bacterium]